MAGRTQPRKKRQTTRPQAQPTAGRSRERQTDYQRSINRATGANRATDGFKSARNSADVFAQAFMNNPMATAADRSAMRRDMRNSRRRRSNGGSGG